MLVWNRRIGLGAPVQLIQNKRYQSRMLVAHQPGESCGDVLVRVRDLIQQAKYTPGNPWGNLTAGTAQQPIPQLPPDWPAGKATLPFANPGSCLILLDGIWQAQSQTLSVPPSVPGTFPWDFWAQENPQQMLVQGPTPPAVPCAPGQLSFDIVAGVFKCAGQVIQQQIPLPITPPLSPPVNVPPVNLPPVNVPPTQTTPKKEETAVWPWVVGGGALLGVGYLLTRG